MSLVWSDGLYCHIDIESIHLDHCQLLTGTETRHTDVVIGISGARWTPEDCSHVRVAFAAFFQRFLDARRAGGWLPLFKFTVDDSEIVLFSERHQCVRMDLSV